MPDSRSKTLSMVQGHRTIAEKELRKRGEASMITGVEIKKSKAVEADEVASAYFDRALEFLDEIDIADACIENVLNRYCVMLSECDAAAEERKIVAEGLVKLEDRENEMESKDYFAAMVNLTKSLNAMDRGLNKKRDQLLAIERENLMTLQGKLRAVPKKPEQNQPSGMAAFMKKRAGG